MYMASSLYMYVSVCNIHPLLEVMGAASPLTSHLTMWERTWSLVCCNAESSSIISQGQRRSNQATGPGWRSRQGDYQQDQTDCPLMSCQIEVNRRGDQGGVATTRTKQTSVVFASWRQQNAAQRRTTRAILSPLTPWNCMQTTD